MGIDTKMKTQMTLFFTLALLALLARAEPNYEDFILNLKFPLQNYRILPNDLQIETLQPEDADLSAVSFRKLTFTAQETECNSTTDTACSLKENGKRMLCDMDVTHPVQGIDEISAFEIRCDVAEEDLQTRIRTKRSRSGNGSGRGGRGGNGGSRGGRGSSSRGGNGGSRGGRGGRGGRSGSGSSIAGRGNGGRGNGGTRTA